MITTPSKARQDYYARQRRQIADLRLALIDLLSVVSASNDPIPASTDMIIPEPERLRQAARRIEQRDAIIYRARAVIDGTNEADKEETPE